MKLTEQQDTRVTEIVFNEVYGGGSIIGGLHKAAKEMSCTTEKMEKYWYRNLHDQHKHRLLPAKKVYYKPEHKEWEPKEQALLINSVAKYLREGKPLNVCFEEVAEKVKRTISAVESEWYQKLKKQPKVKAFIERATGKAA